jgi:leishmanolysin
MVVVAAAGVIAACGGGGGGTQPPGPPANIAANSTTSQTGLTGNSVTTLPSVKVTDADGRAVPGASVLFQLTGGGGSIGGAVATTNSSGVASLGSWTLGPSAGANTVDASGNGTTLAGAPVTFTVNASAPVSNFTIALQNIGPAVSPTRQAAFDNAKARWQQVILGDLTDFNGTNIGNTGANCGNVDLTGTVIDDVLILFTLDSIDGPGKILGAAGPCFIRQSNSLTIVGIMRFDTADVAGLEANGSLNDVILHEMGHVLGYGTLWTNFNLLQGACTTAPTYSGLNAVNAFVSSNGGSGTTVPVENFATGGCNNGTRDSHWEEDVFQSEVMTGFISGTVRPLSLTSVRSFQDLGYVVNPGAADPFNINTQPSLRADQTAFPKIPLGNDILNIPLYAVDDGGRVRMIRDKQ